MGVWVMDYTLDELHEALKFLFCREAPEVSGNRNLTQLSIGMGLSKYWLICHFWVNFSFNVFWCWTVIASVTSESVRVVQNPQQAGEFINW